MEYQWIKCHFIGTNHTIGTNGREECTPTQPKALGNIVSPYNDMHAFHLWNTNGRPWRIVFLEVAYYATGSTRNFAKLCQNYARKPKLCS